MIRLVLLLSLALLALQQYPPNCAILNLANRLCIACENGFTLANNACIQLTSSLPTASQSHTQTISTLTTSPTIQPPSTFTTWSVPNTIFFPWTNTQGSAGSPSGTWSGSAGASSSGQSASSSSGQSTGGSSGQSTGGWSGQSTQSTGGWSGQSTGTSSITAGMVSRGSAGSSSPNQAGASWTNPTWTNTAGGSTNTAGASWNSGASSSWSVSPGPSSSSSSFSMGNPIFFQPAASWGSAVNRYVDWNCKTMNEAKTWCVQCYRYFYYNPAAGFCVVVDPLCRNYA